MPESQCLGEAGVGMTQQACTAGLVLLHNNNGYQVADTYGEHAFCVSMRGKYLHIAPYNEMTPSRSCYPHFTSEQTSLERLTTTTPVTQPVRDKISLVTQSQYKHIHCI